MEYLFYALMVALRLFLLPFWLVRCVYVYLMAVYKEKGVKVYVDWSRDFPESDGDNVGSGSAGVTDTAATIRAKAGQLGEVKRAGGFGSPN